MSRTSRVATSAPWIVLCLVVVVYILRRPDIVTNAQFWAEDGKVWFTDAVTKGPLNALAIPHTGYLQTFSRLALGLSSLFPWEISPLVANAIALLVRALPAAFFASSRFAWVDPRARALIIAYYLLMPNLAEVHANITNTHWYLALYLGLVSISGPTPSRRWGVHDWLVIFVSGISGPFIIFALPGYALRAIYVRAEWPKFLLVAALSIFAFAVFALSGLDHRPKAPLGATLLLPFQIAVDRVLIGFLRDVNAVDMQPFVLAVIVAATALLTLYVVRKGGWRIVALLALPAAMFCATLASSVVSLTEPQWPLLLKTGDRYFVLPSIVWAATLIAAASYAASRYGATVKNLLFGCGLILLGVTLTSKFHIPAHPDMNWQGSVAAYKAAEDNTIVDLPIVPRGWAIQLPSGLER